MYYVEVDVFLTSSSNYPYQVFLVVFVLSICTVDLAC